MFLEFSHSTDVSRALQHVCRPCCLLPGTLGAASPLESTAAAAPRSSRRWALVSLGQASALALARGLFNVHLFSVLSTQAHLYIVLHPLRPLRITLDPVAFPRNSLTGRFRCSVLARSHLPAASLLTHTGATVNLVSIVDRWCASLGAHGAVRVSDHMVEPSARQRLLTYPLLPTPFGPG